MSYILSIDQGTSSSRAILFDNKAQIISTAQKEFKQYYPQQLWVEQKPKEILQTQIQMLQEAVKKAKIDTKEIAAIGITNQRETAILWDKKTGEPVYNAIVWQDKRTLDYCNSLKKNYTEIIQNKTGLIIDSYFSATKIKWILDNNKNLRKRAEKGEILFGTVDSWLVWNISKDKIHITDYSNASRTMLFNINTLEWDEELLELFDIPKSILPEVRNSSEIYSYTDSKILGSEIPIASIIGDQQSALFGQTCFEKGMTKNTYGTGCFMLMNIGEKMQTSKHKLLTTIAWGLNGKISYAFEGSVFMAGASIKWLRDQLQIIKNASETEALAYSVKDTHGVYVIPAFAGLGAPYWDSKANGAVFGLTLGATKAHIVRATLESIAYRSKDILNLMEKDAQIKLPFLNVDGGASMNQFLMQFQADILGIKVNRPKINETTALGAAYLAGLAVGVWDIEQIKQIHTFAQKYEAKMNKKESKELYQGWKSAINHLLSKV